MPKDGDFFHIRVFFCHKGGVMCISEVTDLSPGNHLHFVNGYFSFLFAVLNVVF